MIEENKQNAYKSIRFSTLTDCGYTPLHKDRRKELKLKAFHIFYESARERQLMQQLIFELNLIKITRI